METAAFIFRVRNHEDASRMLLWNMAPVYHIITRHVLKDSTLSSTLAVLEYNGMKLYEMPRGGDTFFNKTPLSIQAVLSGREGT
jgi:hypothetical protein